MNKKCCDRCEREYEVFNGEQAWDLSTFRSDDGKAFVSCYGSGYDGDVMEVKGQVPSAMKAVCDLCVREMLDAGTLVFSSNYLDMGDWVGQPIGAELRGDWEEVK